MVALPFAFALARDHTGGADLTRPTSPWGRA